MTTGGTVRGDDGKLQRYFDWNTLPFFSEADANVDRMVYALYGMLIIPANTDNVSTEQRID